MFKVSQFVVGLEIKQGHVFLKGLETEHLQEQFRCLLGNGTIFGLSPHDQNMIGYLIIIGKQEIVGQSIVEQRLSVQLVKDLEQMYQKIL